VRAAHTYRIVATKLSIMVHNFPDPSSQRRSRS
jgi:hypothetical protein